MRTYRFEFTFFMKGDAGKEQGSITFIVECQGMSEKEAQKVANRTAHSIRGKFDYERCLIYSNA